MSPMQTVARVVDMCSTNTLTRKRKDYEDKIENIKELNEFRKNLIIFWELLNSKKAYRHIVKQL